MKLHLGLFTAIVLAAAWLVCAGEARASLVIAIPNFSFNNPNVADGAFTDSDVDLDPVPDWLFTSVAVDGMGDPAEGNVIIGGVWDPEESDYNFSTGNDATLPGTADGGQTAYLFLNQDGSGDVVPMLASLTTSEPLGQIASNTRYDLAVAVGNSKTMDPANVRIEILANAQVVAFAAADASTLANSNGTFVNLTASFTTVVNDPLEGDDLRVRLVHTFDDEGPREVEFDNIRLESTFIPEPASAATVLLGAATLMLRRPRATAQAAARANSHL